MSQVIFTLSIITVFALTSCNQQSNNSQPISSEKKTNARDKDDDFTYNGKPISPKALCRFHMDADSGFVHLNLYPFDDSIRQCKDWPYWATSSQRQGTFCIGFDDPESGTGQYAQYMVLGKTNSGKFIVLFDFYAGGPENFHDVLVLDRKGEKLNMDTMISPVDDLQPMHIKDNHFLIVGNQTYSLPN
jgi:hypothetical protein